MRTGWTTPAVEQRLGRIVAEHLRWRARISLVAVGVVDGDLEQEPVVLRFGQRIGSFVLDRVLRGEDGEVRRERVGVAVDGDARVPAWPGAARTGFWPGRG